MLGTARGSFFRNCQVVGALGPEVADWVGEHAEVVRVPRRSSIWTPGQPSDAVYWVRSGIVKVTRVMDQGRELTLHFHPKGALIGEDAVYTRDPRHTLAEAYQESELYAVPAEEMDRLVKLSPDLSLALAGLVHARRRVLEERVGVLLFKTAHARLASLLLELAQDFGVRDSRGVIVNLKLTHREMASLIGATRETVSFAIVDLRKAGILQTEGKRVILLDEARLRELEAA